MDKALVEQMKQKAVDEFNTLQTEGEQKRREVEQIEDRLKELRGKYQSYEEILQGLDRPDPATTVVAEPVAPEPKPRKKRA